MSAFFIFLFIFGSFEIISNLFHLTRGSKAKIAQSAKRQHGEIPKELSDGHFVVKAYAMLGIGIIFIMAALIPQSYIITLAALGLLGFYGIIQALVYRKHWAVIPSAIVYNTPLLLFIFYINE